MKIGFIGLGTMGNAMCSNIIKKHKDNVYAFDINPDALKKIVKKGAIPCDSCIEIAEKSEMIFSIMPRSEHTRSTYMEMLPYLTEHHICVDMGTIDPKVSIEIAKKVKEKGAQFADAPVTKPAYAAVAGESGILVGSSDETFQAIYPILKYMGTDIVHVGPNGHGLYVKICQNCLTHSIQQAVNECVTLANLYGVTIETFFEACNNGGAGNLYFKNKFENLRNDDYTMSFSIDYTVKDLGLAEKLAIEANFVMPAMQAALNNSRRAMLAGYGDQDTSATILTVREGLLKKTLSNLNA